MLGVLPCAGQQSRMQELVFSKELLPLFDSRPVIQHSIDALRQTTNDLLAIVHPKKKDLVRYLKKQNVNLIVATTNGPYSTLKLAAEKTTTPFLFALTDTYYQPENVFTQLAAHPKPNVLGLFDSGTPERFDSVRLQGQQIVSYAVKIDPPLSPWTMGCGKLSPQTFKSTGQLPEQAEPIFGHLLIPLAQQGSLYGIRLKDSRFFDLGTPHNYIEYLLHRFPHVQATSTL